jgi:diadenylate cyclase
MSFFEIIAEQMRRIRTYPVYEVLIELALIWLFIFVIVQFLRGTGAARIIKGVALVLIASTALIQFLSSQGAFERLEFVHNNLLTFASIAVVIIFQPELRRALGRLGEARLFKVGGLRKAQVIEELLSAINYLSTNQLGALIVMEREVGLDGLIESGTRLDAEVSEELLNTIFWPGSALHDMAVVIRRDRVAAAGVQLPLAEAEHFTSELGSRHRAAMGLSQESDALVIVVSEETGIVSLAERGRLIRNLSLDGLRTLLVRGLGQITLSEGQQGDGKAEG